MGHDAFSKEQTLRLRAILCLIVVFAHSNEGILYEFGPAAVSVFFFLSGFALAKTTWSKDITNRYILSKFLNLLIPAFMVEILYRILYIFYDTVNHYNSIKGTINGLMHFEPAIFAGWYIEVLVLLFFMYFISFKFSGGNKKKFICLYLLIYFVYLIYDIFYGKSIVAAATAHYFFFGVIFELYRNFWKGFYEKRKWINYLMLILPMISLLFLIYTYPMKNSITTIAIMIFDNIFPLLLFYFSLNVKLKGKFLDYIAKLSLFIYLTHVGIQYIIMSILPLWGITINWIVLTFFLASLAISIILSIPLDLIHKQIKKLTSKKLEI